MSDPAVGVSFSGDIAPLFRPTDVEHHESLWSISGQVRVDVSSVERPQRLSSSDRPIAATDATRGPVLEPTAVRSFEAMD
jgi:hypothetical protein